MFNITNIALGIDFGTYEAATAAEALEMFARDAGYATYADACEVADGADILVSEVM